jgi:signal transduction histidine kinase/CHASE3 domain sensor protein
MQITRYQKLLSALSLFAALLIATNAWLAFHAEDVLATSEYWVTHTLEILTNLERSLHTAADAESGVRGYVLTGDASYLGGYSYARTALPAQFDLLEHLAGDNPPQVARLQRAGALAQQKLERLGVVVELRRTNQIARQQMMMAEGIGRELMIRLNSAVQGAETEERRLLAQRLRESAHARREAKLTVALASTLDILFVAFSLWLLSHERRLRERAAEVSTRLEKLQSVTEVAFTQLTVGELTSELLARLRVTAKTDVLALCRLHGMEIELVAAEGITLHPGERRLVRSDGAISAAVESGEVIRLAGDELRRLPLESLHATLGSALIVPMMVASKVVAVLVAGRESRAGFPTDDEELLRLAADRIALALDRAAAYDAERDARRAAEASAAEILTLNAVLEERVQQRTAELESTNRELEAFSYSVSHDLRAPLRTVDGFSVALAEDYGHLLEGDGQHYLTRIRAGVQRMGQLIDALLQLSRITRADFHTEQVDLSALAAAAAEDVLLNFPDRKINISIEPGLQAEGDPRLLRVIFENMFGNAAKFTSKIPDAQVSFGWSPERKAYSIRDNGAGFDQQYAGKLFVAFQRLHGDKDFQGSGIGLATVGRVIARHHGTVAAEGVVGKGATFWFTLG